MVTSSVLILLKISSTLSTFLNEESSGLYPKVL
ncbi:hypothetical protein SRH_01900 [Mesomycoplasma hyorhinis MCLD]|uniref:Uncharacterized protein n=1 Tax=Mesomycoplasma hyorhinis (strain MCLD) TaxID=936139 RepID=A0ABM5M5E4_MESHM|nr:hypothetical protein SRH_01900 [Mesomycoplasma hyorhinis MCLD]